jgi:hypothetical protein
VRRQAGPALPAPRHRRGVPLARRPRRVPARRRRAIRRQPGQLPHRLTKATREPPADHPAGALHPYPDTRVPGAPGTSPDATPSVATVAGCSQNGGSTHEALGKDHPRDRGRLRRHRRHRQRDRPDTGPPHHRGRQHNHRCAAASTHDDPEAGPGARGAGAGRRRPGTRR